MTLVINEATMQTVGSQSRGQISVRLLRNSVLHLTRATVKRELRQPRVFFLCHRNVKSQIYLVQPSSDRIKRITELEAWLIIQSPLMQNMKNCSFSASYNGDVTQQKQQNDEQCHYLSNAVTAFFLHLRLYFPFCYPLVCYHFTAIGNV